MNHKTSLLLLIACMYAAGCDSERKPAVVAPVPWKFVVIGDTRGTASAGNPINATVLPEIARAVAAEGPEIVIVTGDLVDGTNPNSFTIWKQAMEPVYQADIMVCPIRGNHDIALADEWQAAFGADLPDNGPPNGIDFTFAVSNRNALFIGMDQYLPGGKVDQSWLESVLASADATHVFVYGHEPAFQVVHTDCLATYPEMRNAFWNALVDFGVRIYFCGHDHLYDHARIDDGDGIEDNDSHQYIVGGGGAPPHSWSGQYGGNKGIWEPVNVYHDPEYGYLVGLVDGDTVTLTWLRRIGPDQFEEAETFSFTNESRES